MTDEATILKMLDRLSDIAERFDGISTREAVVERAARAIYAVELARDENCNSLIIKMGGNPHPSTRIEAYEENPESWREYATAALESSGLFGAIEALDIFVRCACPVTEEIDARGHSWSEAYLDQALETARSALQRIKTK